MPELLRDRVIPLPPPPTEPFVGRTLSIDDFGLGGCLYDVLGTVELGRVIGLIFGGAIPEGFAALSASVSRFDVSVRFMAKNKNISFISFQFSTVFLFCCG